jgi:ribonuclease inhibitor
MRIDIEGGSIRSEADFHEAIARALGLAGHYGRNLDALWDVLSTDVERPLSIVWKHSEQSRASMSGFAKVVDVLRRVEEHDAALGLDDRFELHLE